MYSNFFFCFWPLCLYSLPNLILNKKLLLIFYTCWLIKTFFLFPSKSSEVFYKKYALGQNKYGLGQRRMEWDGVGMCCRGMIGITCFEKSLAVWSEGQEEARTTKEDVADESKSVGLAKEDAMNQARWRVGVGEITVIVG